jgi:hypothetical protein
LIEGKNQLRQPCGVAKSYPMGSDTGLNLLPKAP